jgi:hypothetical protein
VQSPSLLELDLLALPSVVQLNEYASGELFELANPPVLAVRGPGTYKQVAEIRGNSLLSSVFIRSIDPGATLKINYYDTTTGATFNERFELTGHDLIDDSVAPLTTFRILVTKIHHRIVAEAVVMGGNVDFSLYATTVSSTASDLDAALIRDEDVFNQPTNKAIPVATLDESDGKLYFLRSKAGVLTIEQNFGLPFYLKSTDAKQTLPNSNLVLVSGVVPVSKVWRLRRLEAQCRAYGYFEIFIDSTRIARSNSSPVSDNPFFHFDPFVEATAGETVTIQYTQSYGPSLDVSAFLFATEENA